jgi:excisionase family DNA binding protein
VLVSKRFATLDQAADELGCSKRHVRRLISTGQLRAYRVGKDSSLVRIDRSDLDKVLVPLVPSGAS